MNRHLNNLPGVGRLCTILSLAILITSAVDAQTPTATTNNHQKIAAGATPVVGSGTLGRLPKWIGSTGSSVIGDSMIFEDKFGQVGIGTDTPTSRLTVSGMIETTLGGYKFPDGSIQTTAGISADMLAGSSTVAVTRSGNTLTLGLPVPLILTGSVDNGNGIITVTNVAAGAPAIFAVGGNSSPTIGGGSGVLALGGTGANSSPGGVGLVSFGGNSSAGAGGTGGSLIGGVATNGNGGDGLFAVGALGVGTGKKGGRGIVAIPGGGASGATGGLAGQFIGDVEVTGNLSKGGGSFKIDHPLDPENKYLYHSFVESPDMMNVYNGNIMTDENGDAVVKMPDYFQALNKDFRYQLTVIGTFAQAIIGEKMKGNSFRIKTSAPNVEVSWQVTGIRHDAYANKHRIPTEEQKLEVERGFFLHPDAFNQPEERGIEWARNPEMARQMKEARSRQLEEAKPKAPGNDR
jgi:hypothetical protein